MMMMTRLFIYSLLFADNTCGGAPYIDNGIREPDPTGNVNVTYTCDEGYHFQDTLERVKVIDCSCEKGWTTENIDCIGEYMALNLAHCVVKHKPHR